MSFQKSIFLLVLLGLCLSPVDGLAQSDAAEAAEGPGNSGFRLVYGPTFVWPLLNEQAQAPFDSVGEFRGGPGIRLAAGYRYRFLELTASADYAGVEAGEPFVENEIEMGRKTAIVRAYAVQLMADLPVSPIWEFVPKVGVGYLSGGVDNLLVARNELPAELMDFASTVESTNVDRPTGVSGGGFRLSAAFERPFSSTLAARVQLDIDRMSVDEFIFHQDRLAWEGGNVTVPRLGVLLRWEP